MKFFKCDHKSFLINLKKFSRKVIRKKSLIKFDDGSHVPEHQIFFFLIFYLKTYYHQDLLTLLKILKLLF